MTHQEYHALKAKAGHEELPDLRDAPVSKPLSKSKRYEETFASQCRMRGVPESIGHYKFHPERQWRFDRAWPQYKLAVEIEGLVVMRLFALVDGKYVPRLVTMGRHANVDGFRKDCEKYNTAIELGWGVLRFEQRLIRPGHAIDVTIRNLIKRGWDPACS